MALGSILEKEAATYIHLQSEVVFNLNQNEPDAIFTDTEQNNRRKFNIAFHSASIITMHTFGIN